MSKFDTEMFFDLSETSFQAARGDEHALCQLIDSIGTAATGLHGAEYNRKLQESLLYSQRAVANYESPDATEVTGILARYQQQLSEQP